MRGWPAACVSRIIEMNGAIPVPVDNEVIAAHYRTGGQVLLPQIHHTFDFLLAEDACPRGDILNLGAI